MGLGGLEIPGTAATVGDPEGTCWYAEEPAGAVIAMETATSELGTVAGAGEGEGWVGGTGGWEACCCGFT